MTDSYSLRLKFWGTRGSIPCPGPETVRYGGNTTCFEINFEDQRLIIDAEPVSACLERKFFWKRVIYLMQNYSSPIRIWITYKGCHSLLPFTIQ